MIESKYLKENIENIQRLMSISALKHFETRNLGKLLRLSKIRQYEDGEAIIQEGDMDPWLYFLDNALAMFVLADLAQPKQFAECFGFKILQCRDRHQFLDILDILFQVFRFDHGRLTLKEIRPVPISLLQAVFALAGDSIGDFMKTCCILTDCVISFKTVFG